MRTMPQPSMAAWRNVWSSLLCRPPSTATAVGRPSLSNTSHSCGLALIAAILPVLLGALYVHLGNGWVFSNAGGGWEYPLYLVALAVAQFLLGAGAWSLDRKLGLEQAPA
ncbi:MAG: hypothetical protein RQ741_03815 [Wenzhouxiangellaceae bacterium]|nr:hypothetical protein [Wenzhouxiangellaceae bacterium]